MFKSLYTKRLTFILFSLLTLIIFIVHLLAFIPTINIGQYIGEENWVYVPILLSDIVLSLVFLVGSRLILQTRFKFSLAHVPDLIFLGWPALLVVVYNIFFITDTSLFTYSIGTGFSALSLSFISSLFIGLFEELLFRGGFFNLFLVLFKKQKKVVLWSAISSSLLFSSVHLTNLTWQGEWDTINQVFSAFSIGLFLSLVYYRTKSLLIPILLHTLINTTDIFFKLTIDQRIGVMTGFDWSTYFFSAVFLFVSYYLLMNTNLDNQKSLLY